MYQWPLFGGLSGGTENEKNFPAQEASAERGSWLPAAYEHQERPQGHQCSPRQGPQEPDCLIFFEKIKTAIALEKKVTKKLVALFFHEDSGCREILHPAAFFQNFFYPLCASPAKGAVFLGALAI